MHWGTVSPWRPIDHFAEALEIVGKVIDPRQRHILERELGKNLILTDLRPYQEVRRLAQRVDYHLVAVSARHMDNIPSKMIELLSFRKPLLLLAHPKSEAAAVVHKYVIGTVAHPNDRQVIENAIKKLESDRQYFVQGYSNSELAVDWGCPYDAMRFRENLCAVLNW